MIMRTLQVLMLGLMLAVVACGGGGGGGGSNPASTPSPNIVQSITVSPAYVSTNTGTNQQLTATATYADGSTANVTSIASWVSAAPTVVSVSNTGLAAAGGTAQNGVNITASIGAATGKSGVSVTNPADALTAIIVPFNQTIYTGQSWLPTTWADANFANGTGVSPYTLVKWTISNCSPANAASVNADGTIAANAPGTCSITASSGAITSTAKTLTVKIPAITSITIIPSPVSLAVGGNLQLTVMGTYQDGSQKNVTNLVNWSTSNAAAITVGTASNKGLVAGIAAGSAIITASQPFPAPATDPLYSAATVTVTVPGAAPTQTTANFSPVEDNTVMYSSLVPARQSTVYGTNAMFSNPAIAVGCAWYYSLVLKQMDASCSEGLLKFNLGSLAGKTVTNATLQLQASSVGVGIVPRQWYVRALASPWSGASVTWDNSRSSTYYIHSQTTMNPPATIGQVVNINLTDTVRNWVAGTYQNNGLTFVLSNYLLPNMYDISLDQFEFHSSEDGSGRGPVLSVTYQ
jgi:hypothetical protein